MGEFASGFELHSSSLGAVGLRTDYIEQPNKTQDTATCVDNNMTEVMAYNDKHANEWSKEKIVNAILRSNGQECEVNQNVVMKRGFSSPPVSPT